MLYKFFQAYVNPFISLSKNMDRIKISTRIQIFNLPKVLSLNLIGMIYFGLKKRINRMIHRDLHLQFYNCFCQFLVPHHTMYGELWKLCKFSIFGFWRIYIVLGSGESKKHKISMVSGCQLVCQYVCQLACQYVSLLVCGDDTF